MNRLALTDLPAIKQPLAGGTYFGAITKPDGQLCAVVLLDARPTEDLNWSAALAWAKEAGGELPTRPVAALLFAAVKDLLQPRWHWTSDEERDEDDEGDASFAWLCHFGYGNQNYNDKSYEGRALAVRMIPLTVQSLNSSVEAEAS